jgi:hypothetical protein
MNIDNYHQFILYILNKEQTAWMTPAEIDNALHRSQMDAYDYYAPIYGTDETAKKALDPFLTTYFVTPANSPAGLVNLPANFGHLLGGDAISYDNVRGTQYWPIDFVNNDEFSTRIMSQLIPVTQARPIAKTVGAGVIQLYPQVPNTAQFPYLTIPVPPVAFYTQAGRVLTYVPGSSTQLQWNDSFATKLIKRALYYMGINIEDQTLIQLMGEQQRPAA